MSEMDCKCGCGQQIEEKPGGHRQRLFVDDAHKMRWHRQQQQNDQQEALLAELTELRTKVADQAHTIELQQQEIERLAYHYKLARQFQDDGSELEQENTRLKKQLDYERRFIEDITPYYFRKFLKKQPSSPWRDRFLSDQTIKPRSSRSYYQAQMKRLGCTEEEMEDFVRQWKLMLMQS